LYIVQGYKCYLEEKRKETIPLKIKYCRIYSELKKMDTQTQTPTK
jgi:hypothetical protein